VATTQLTTSDGHRLAADVAVPDGATRAVVVCHPHPQYGGNRFNPVVEAVYTRAIDVGLAAIRFDFRADHGGGAAEPLDVIAALDEIGEHAPGPFAVAGYSFGAAIALLTDDDRISAIAAIAPPLAMMTTLPPPHAATLVLAPRHDQFTSVDAATGIVAGWPAATLEVVESADHFLTGRTGAVADRVVSWITTTLG
jgi:alpha/beta superfamily hydrolase